MVSCTKESGTCGTCRSGCTRKPGWFLPGEAELAAEHLGLTLEEFFARYLAVDWWEAEEGEQDIFVLSPIVVDAEAGTEFPADPRGTCVFYKGGRCEIHAVKPFECREHWCGAPGGRAMHRDAGFAWKDHQDQLTTLLGREPQAQQGDVGTLLDLLFDGLEGLGSWLGS